MPVCVVFVEDELARGVNGSNVGVEGRIDQLYVAVRTDWLDERSSGGSTTDLSSDCAIGETVGAARSTSNWQKDVVIGGLVRYGGDFGRMTWKDHY